MMFFPVECTMFYFAEVDLNICSSISWRHDPFYFIQFVYISVIYLPARKVNI